MVVARVMVVRHRLVLAEAEVAAATTAAATETSRCNGANDDTSLKVGEGRNACRGVKSVTMLLSTCNRVGGSDTNLASRRGDHKVRVDVLLAKLLSNVQSQRAIVVIDVALRLVTQN